MKTAALWKLCKEHEEADIWQDEAEGRQWRYVQGCVYPLDGMPWLDKEGLLTMMDVSAEDWLDWNIRIVPMNETMRRYVSDAGEDTLARMAGVTIEMDSFALKPVYVGEEGTELVLIRENALKPLNDSKKVNELYARKVGGQTYIVVKKGFELIGCLGRVVAPDEEKAGVLKDVASHMLDEAKRIKAEEAKRDGEQQHI